MLFHIIFLNCVSMVDSLNLVRIVCQKVLFGGKFANLRLEIHVALHVLLILSPSFLILLLFPHQGLVKLIA